MNKKYNVLIVEDEPPILNMVKNIIQIRCSSFEVCATAYNGRDAATLISQVNPDVVITDIKMPFVDGLELISTTRQQNAHTKYIILSGYSNFEYARTALRLNVYDYLLKPIDTEALLEIMNKIKAQLDNENQQCETEYLKQQIGLYYQDFPTVPDFSQSCITLLFAYIGALSSRIYGELNYGSYFWSDFDESPVLKLVSGTGGRMYSFTGKYPNERIFAVLYDKPAKTPDHMTVGRIFNCFESDDHFVNMAVSDGINQSGEILGKVRKMEQIITANIVFGKSQIFYETSHYPLDEELICSVDKVKIESMRYCKSTERLKTMILELIDSWKQTSCTQLRLQTELQMLLNLINQKTVNKKSSTFHLQAEANEITSSSSNYDDIYENICMLIDKTNRPEGQNAGQEGAKELIDQIEVYLIENYNKNITYKSFYGQFGYNQTYITNLYKDQKGISPSKFITKLRIQKAQGLMNLNPDMLFKDVAQAVGYDDPLYFSKVFKNFTGESPGKYKTKVEK